MAFVAVANLDDLEVGDTMLVAELREPICLIRLDDDDVRAIHNTCTHQQQPLHEGTLQDDDTLVCAAHASRYDLTTGEAVGPDAKDHHRPAVFRVELGVEGEQREMRHGGAPRGPCGIEGKERCRDEVHGLGPAGGTQM